MLMQCQPWYFSSEWHMQNALAGSDAIVPNWDYKMMTAITKFHAYLAINLTFILLKGHCFGCNSFKSVCGEWSSQTTILYGGGDSSKYDRDGTGGWNEFSKRI